MQRLSVAIPTTFCRSSISKVSKSRSVYSQRSLGASVSHPVSVPERQFFNPFGSSKNNNNEAVTTTSANGRVEHRVSRIVPYPAELMCELSADVAKYHEFLPFCESSVVLDATNQFIHDVASHPHPIPSSTHSGKLSGSAERFEADLSIGFKALSLTYRSLVTVQSPHRVLSEAMPDNAHIFDHLVSEWTFEDQGDNKCKVHILVDFRVRNFLYAGVINGVFVDTAAKQLDAFTKRAGIMAKTWKPKSLQPRKDAKLQTSNMQNAASQTNTYSASSTSLRIAQKLYLDGTLWSDMDIKVFQYMLAIVQSTKNMPFKVNVKRNLIDLAEAAYTVLDAQNLNIVMSRPASFLSLPSNSLVLSKQEFFALCTLCAAYNSQVSPIYILSRYSEYYTLEQVATQPKLQDLVWSFLVKAESLDLGSCLSVLHLLTRTNPIQRVNYILHKCATCDASGMYVLDKQTLQAQLTCFFDLQFSILESGISNIVTFKCEQLQEKEIIFECTQLMQRTLKEAKFLSVDIIQQVLSQFPLVTNNTVQFNLEQWEHVWMQSRSLELLDTATVNGLNDLITWSIQETIQDKKRK